jgi:predicted ABC-type transport system involved in lysophospholipase L1 biosynthesis ATPase subunit
MSFTALVLKNLFRQSAAAPVAVERTGSLDSEAGGRVLDLQEELRRTRALTLLLVTHDRRRRSRRVRMLDTRLATHQLQEHRHVPEDEKRRNRDQ